MVLSNPDHPSAHRVHDTVGVAHPPWLARGFRYRDRRSATLLAVEPLVGIVAEIDDPATNQISATAIFVDPGSYIEGVSAISGNGRRHIHRPAILRAADDDRPAPLQRPAFDPVDVALIDQDIAKTDRRSHDQIRCYR